MASKKPIEPDEPVGTPDQAARAVVPSRSKDAATRSWSLDEFEALDEETAWRLVQEIYALPQDEWGSSEWALLAMHLFVQWRRSNEELKIETFKRMEIAQKHAEAQVRMAKLEIASHALTRSSDALLSSLESHLAELRSTALQDQRTQGLATRSGKRVRRPRSDRVWTPELRAKALQLFESISHGKPRSTGSKAARIAVAEQLEREEPRAHNRSDQERTHRVQEVAERLRVELPTARMERLQQLLAKEPPGLSVIAFSDELKRMQSLRAVRAERARTTAPKSKLKPSRTSD